jgi:hypothetical protein
VPTKFVQRSAERAGVSVETAEHRWSEAKHAIKKGKRKGHWYWGKVVNTFKKMMGLSEGMSFKDFLDAEIQLDEAGRPVPLRYKLRAWPQRMYVGLGCFMVFTLNAPGRAIYTVHQFGDDEPIGTVIIFTRQGQDWWSLHEYEGKQVAVSRVPSIVEVTDIPMFKMWIEDAIPLLSRYEPT